MSHAAVLVALEGPLLYSQIEAAVFHQMEPFNENGEWFKAGSRWDWWIIGGRYAEMLPNPIMRREEVADLRPFPAFYAFLKDRNWHERSRLGWFGGKAEPESEPLKSGVCHQDETTGAKIINWADDLDWVKKFFERFVQDLPPQTILVVVDYHV